MIELNNNNNSTALLNTKELNKNKEAKVLKKKKQSLPIDERDGDKENEDDSKKVFSPIILNEMSKSVTAHSLNPSTFTQKLYVMLQDENLKDVIYWNEETKNSFFIIPNEKFIQILSIFFKHCNTSSFVRQLNMYSFHKISGNTNTLWEFKHAQSLFQKDDIESLYKVKRRSIGNKSNNNNNSGNNSKNGINENKNKNSISEKSSNKYYQQQSLKRKSSESNGGLTFGTEEGDDSINNNIVRKRPRVASLPNTNVKSLQQEEKNNNFFLYKNGQTRMSDPNILSNRMVQQQQQQHNIPVNIDIYKSEKPLLINHHDNNNSNSNKLSLPSRNMSFVSNKGENISLHNVMLQELSVMNNSLQNMCDVVEMSFNHIKNSPEGLTTQDNQMYRRKLDELCIELREKEHSLRQCFNMQFGSGVIVNHPSAGQFSLVTPSTPFGSVSYQQSQHVATTIPLNMKHAITQPAPPPPPPQAFYSVPVEDVNGYSHVQCYDPSKPYHPMGIPPMQQQQQQSVPKVYQLPLTGYPVQTQFRDVKYEENNNNNPQLPRKSFSNLYAPADNNINQTTKKLMIPINNNNNNNNSNLAAASVVRNNSLPSLKDVINMNNIAKLTSGQKTPKSTIMQTSRSEESPKSSK
ncbi:hypothetical protein ACO0SA_004511 [Hanseniaspora valbyensis]